MSRPVAVVGVGQTKHAARRSDHSIMGLVREAVDRALADAGLEHKDIDAVVIGKAPDMLEGVAQPEQMLVGALGAHMKPMIRVHTAGSVGASTAITAATHVQSGLFDRVLCGVDHSEAGVAAARVAATVTAAEGTLTLLAVEDPSIAVHAGWNMPHVLEELAADAAGALEQGRAAAEPVHPVEIRLSDGDPVQRLLAEIATKNASAVVVGSHGRSRATGIAEVTLSWKYAARRIASLQPVAARASSA